MTNDKTAKMLERVRALLAKADSTQFPQEADAFRAKADELMTAYAIEQWQVEAHANGRSTRPQPEQRVMNFDWWTTSSRSDELWTLFSATAFHCRCVIAIRGYTHYGQGMPVVGLPSDLDYMDLLFTHLMLQMGKNLEPHPDPNGELGAEVFKLRQAGMPWPRITQLIYEAGLTELTKGERAKVYVPDPNGGEDTGRPLWSRIPDPVRQSVKNRLANANRRYVADHELKSERNYTRPTIYQRSFAMGFVQEIKTRFAEMRRAQEPQQTGSQALALRDIRQQALDLYNELYPAPEGRTAGSGRSVSREVRIDWRAYDTGKREGRKADLAAKPGARVGQRRQLDR